MNENNNQNLLYFELTEEPALLFCYFFSSAVRNNGGTSQRMGGMPNVDLTHIQEHLLVSLAFSKQNK